MAFTALPLLQRRSRKRCETKSGDGTAPADPGEEVAAPEQSPDATFGDEVEEQEEEEDEEEEHAEAEGKAEGTGEEDEQGQERGDRLCEGGADSESD
ncbi:hypothetical protein TGDOM2_361560 [Toxoplasma gondii GAB2-2007-GAL-DOM2]|uniref:Uncharacterized protein n=2 Tax=Toxoplasma gondii TaxID=5811 RepID=A0A2T6J3W2_TOXGO|nr:hypothetical protein TGDOM2_361560 [Toxoplasma gondii GAB2-2007-GAL-DOM2]PUA92283.1 hypothetical protein TGBR9_361560 [Toxoplasma gondii TgCATBr9]